MIVHPISQVECFSCVCGGVVLITFSTLEPVDNIFGVTVDFTFDEPFCSVVCLEGFALLNV